MIVMETPLEPLMTFEAHVGSGLGANAGWLSSADAELGPGDWMSRTGMGVSGKVAPMIMSLPMIFAGDIAAGGATMYELKFG